MQQKWFVWDYSQKRRWNVQRFEGTTSVTNVDGRARVTLCAVNTRFLVLRNRIFETEKQIFRSIYGIKGRRETEGLEEMREPKREFAYKGEASIRCLQHTMCTSSSSEVQRGVQTHSNSRSQNWNDLNRLYFNRFEMYTHFYSTLPLIH